MSAKTNDKGSGIGNLDEPDVSQKLTILLAIYAQLYGELRDKDSRLTQVAGWGVTGLGATLFLTGGNNIKANQEWMVSILLLVAVVALLFTLYQITVDRLSIAKALGNLHKCLRFHTENTYFKCETVLPNEWKDWGSDWKKDALAQTAIAYLTSSSFP